MSRIPGSTRIPEASSTCITGIILLILKLAVIAYSTFDNETTSPFSGIDLPWARETFWHCELAYDIKYVPKQNSQDLIKLLGVESSGNNSVLCLHELLMKLKKSWPHAHMGQVVAMPLRALPGLLKNQGASNFPPIVHMTVPDVSKLTRHQALSISSWILLNPLHTLLIYGDEDVHNVISRHFPQHLDTFKKLESPVERTDLWRYLVLCAFGGVYADSDVIAAVPINAWHAIWEPGVNLVVGLENLFRTEAEASHRGYARQVQWAQWTLAGGRNHPTVCGMGQLIQMHMNDEKAGKFLNRNWTTDRAILERTGPGIWTDALEKYFNSTMITGLPLPQILENITTGEAKHGLLIGDIWVLPQLAFGCPSEMISINQFRASLRRVRRADKAQSSKTAEHEEGSQSFVFHQFMGSWRSIPP